jgi:ABC-type multidrug transport system fused ATPase/permease subunit
MAIGAVIEMAGIAMIFPLLQLAIDPASLPQAAKLQKLFGFSDPNGLLVFLCIAVFIFFLFKNATLVGIVYLQNHIVNLKQAEFSLQLFRAYLSRPYIDHIRQNSAEIVRNITWSTSILFGNGLLASLTLLMESMLVAAAAMVLLILEPVGTVVAGVILAAIMGTLYAATRNRLTTWGAGNKTNNATMIQILNESMATFKEIRILGRDDRFATNFNHLNQECASYRTRLSLVAQLPRLVGEVAIIGTIVMAVVVVTILQGRTLIEIMPLMGAFAAAALRILPSVNRIVVNASAIRQSIPVIEDLYRDFHAVNTYIPSRNAIRVSAFTSKIQIENVSFRYRDALLPSLRDVSLEIRPGESVAFVGASGAGKSTLADIMLGILDPDSGQVMIDGKNVIADWFSGVGRFGYVPQNVALLDASLRDNIAFGLPKEDIDDEKIAAAVQIAQITDFIATLPRGLDTIVGERGVRLSGGQRQRVGIARAIYDDPDILVLDEATSSLDNLTEEEFTRAIESFRGRKTVIIIAHRLSTVQKCDRLFFLANGRLVDSGSFDDLVRRNAEFRHMARIDTAA